MYMAAGAVFTKMAGMPSYFSWSFVMNRKAVYLRGTVKAKPRRHGGRSMEAIF
jgi:hypothetical protein